MFGCVVDLVIAISLLPFIGELLEFENDIVVRLVFRLRLLPGFAFVCLGPIVLEGLRLLEIGGNRHVVGGNVSHIVLSLRLQQRLMIVHIKLEYIF